MSKLAEVQDNLQQIIEEQADSDFFTFSELLKDYLSQISAVKVIVYITYPLFTIKDTVVLWPIQVIQFQFLKTVPIKLKTCDLQDFKMKNQVLCPLCCPADIVRVTLQQFESEVSIDWIFKKGMMLRDANIETYTLRLGHLDTINAELLFYITCNITCTSILFSLLYLSSKDGMLHKLYQQCNTCCH